jgi:predicted RNase H-like HicB family nuclease
LHYLTRIYWSDGDEGFVAEVPALPGCVGVGETPAKALRDDEIGFPLAQEHGEKRRPDS